jgi:hypothetical protein
MRRLCGVHAWRLTVRSEAKEVKDMRQPIIDPDKVNAWTASMRDAFSGGNTDIGMWVVIGLTALVLVAVIWSASRRPGPDAMEDLDNLIKAKPAAGRPAKSLGHGPVRH